jgi:ArsR family transcriptional regulator, arsenate/arsenite/antimonite-responsive transcriptional repressor
MAVGLELAPKTNGRRGSAAASPSYIPTSSPIRPSRMATSRKRLATPVRLKLVDVLRKHAGKLCVCELVPQFGLSQPTVSHHLKVLREPGSSAPSANASEAGLDNVEFLKGYLDDIPLPDGSVDVSHFELPDRSVRR